MSELRILIIEDNQMDIFMLQEMLAESIKMNYELDVTLSLASGLKKLKSDSYDALLLDLNLPDSNGGISVIEQVLECDNQVPIVIITGNEDDELALEAVRLGAQDFIHKDYLNSYIISKSIHFAIERFGLMKEIEKLKGAEK